MGNICRKKIDDNSNYQLPQNIDKNCPFCSEISEIKLLKFNSDGNIIFHCENEKIKYTGKFKDFIEKKKEEFKKEPSDYKENNNEYDQTTIQEKNKNLCRIIRFNQIILNTFDKITNNYYHIQNIINLVNSIEEEKNRDPEIFESFVSEIENKRKEQNNAKESLNINNKIKLDENYERVLLCPYEKKINEIGDEGFSSISKIMFKQLKEIDVSCNNIKNIDCLYEMILPHLEYLDMSHNKIENIEPIAQLESKELKEICLQYNNINDIDPFNYSDFPNLKLLRIEENPFDKTNLPKQFKKKIIYEVKTFEKFCKDYNVKVENKKPSNENQSNQNNSQSNVNSSNQNDNLDINIEDVTKLNLIDKEAGVEILEDLFLILPKNNKLKMLILRNNNIKDFSKLTRIPLFNLTSLDLALNEINNISFVTKLRTKKLKSLYLNHNNINNIHPLILAVDDDNNKEKYLPDLKYLSLNKNKFNCDDKKIMEDLKTLNDTKITVDIYPDGYYENEEDD